MILKSKRLSFNWYGIGKLVGMRSLFTVLCTLCFGLSFGQYILPKAQLLIDSGIHRIEIYRESIGVFNFYSKDTLSKEANPVKILHYIILLDDSARIIQEQPVYDGETEGGTSYRYDDKGRLIETAKYTGETKTSWAKVVDHENGQVERIFMDGERRYQYVIDDSNGICLYSGFYRETDSTITTQDPEKYLRTQYFYRKGELLLKKEWQWIVKDGRPIQYVERYHQYVKDRDRKMGSTEEVFPVKEDGSLKLHGWFSDNIEYTSKRLENWAKPGPQLLPSSIHMTLNDYRTLWPDLTNPLTFSGDMEYFNFHYVYQ